MNPEQAKEASKASVIKTLAIDLHACNFGPISLACLKEELSSQAVHVMAHKEQFVPKSLATAYFHGYFDRGTTKTVEDLAFIALPFLGAFDGTSGVNWSGGIQK